jgi:hypothetical protein
MGLLQNRNQSNDPDAQINDGSDGGLLSRRLHGGNSGTVRNMDMAPQYAPPPQYAAQNDEYDESRNAKKQKANKKRKSKRIAEIELDEEFTPARQAFTDNLDDSEILQDEIDAEEATRQFNARVKTAKTAKLAKICTVILVAMSVYLAWLIYGAIITNYDYDDYGNIIAQRMSVSEIVATEEYKDLQSYYLRARGLYEEALTLDYRLACYPDDALIIASDYEAMLEPVAKLSIDIGAAKFGTNYGQFQKQLINWVQTDIAVYLQNISAAISQNDSEKANRAIISRDVMYNDFMLLSQNIAVYGRSIKGITLGDIYEWSPEQFVREELEGLVS